MKLTKNTFYQIICLTTMLFSCTMTTANVKNPVFIDNNKFQNALTSLVTAENINLQGKEVTKNKKTSTELTVSITNGKNIPTSDDQQKVLEKSIAQCIKKNLKDPNEFDSYTILLVKTIKNDGTTKRSWVGNVFKSSEL
ncbi:hypothetical protein ABIB40_003343 [Pedobacter sp. UYP30]|uniref:hypothetical protein n=1 Tax=Pedobacter sp. UYP30 TaxID=1756400 RepID=UPI0033999B7F